MLAMAFNLSQESRNYLTEILTILLAFKPGACNKLMTLPPLPFKTLSGSKRFGKVARSPLRPPWRCLCPAV